MKRSRCRHCEYRGHVTAIPDGLAREAWMVGHTLWCMACGKAWDGNDREIVAALTEDLVGAAAGGA